MQPSQRSQRASAAALAALTTVALAASIAPRGADAAPLPVVSVRKQTDGAVLSLSRGSLRLQVCTPRVIHVTYSPTADFPAQRVPTVIAHYGHVPFRLSSTAQSITIATGKVQVQVDRASGAVRFLDPRGRPVLSEPAGGGKSLTPVTLPGAAPVASHQARQEFTLPADEGIYGLGQHQDGFLDYRGSAVALDQANREVAIPFLVSSRGYGLLWNNPASTVVSAGGSPDTLIPAARLFSDDGKPGGLTGTYYKGENFETQFAKRVDPDIDFLWTNNPPLGLPNEHYSVRWTGSVQAIQGGDYQFVTSTDDGARLWIDGRQFINDWNARAVKNNVAKVHFAPNSRHQIRFEYYQGGWDAAARLRWRPPGAAARTTWESKAADAIDYYFFYGPALDTVTADYAQATGHAPMYGKWAFGLWQCKERYQTQQEWLDIARGYRTRHEPLDNIVQDWFYWDPSPWGSHVFDAKRYPDPAAAIATLHNEDHLHFMISVWGKFVPGTAALPDANYDALNAKGYLYPVEGPTTKDRYYDAFNPSARALYWSQMRDQVFNKGVDAWWLDASEPEINADAFSRFHTAAGLGAQVRNAWPLMHTMGVYQGQRAATNKKRVFILTRSGYAGQQRNGAAVWSGDITAGWDVFANQIPAGLNIGLSGIPYWTTDIGAFFVNYPGGSENPEYRELFTRWFQFGAFCPLFRVHGTSTPKELWRFGPQYEPILVKYDNLRYRLMPYIYSQAWRVTQEGALMMRPLVLDFPQDRTARESKDEFLFGPSILVAPVIQKGAKSRSVYLPKGAAWTDFWTGRRFSGGRAVAAPAPIDTLPLFVKAGAIVPLGPFEQYAAEKPADPIELRVYSGADGSFTLYEDEGDNYNYEKGVHAVIPMAWSESRHTLTIGARRGSFPGMLKNRTFHIVWVAPGRGTGIGGGGGATVRYDGKPLTVSAPAR